MSLKRITGCWMLLSLFLLAGCSVRMTHTLAFSPGGETLAAIGEGDEVLLYDGETLQLKGPLRNPDGGSGDRSRPRSLAFSPDGRHLAAAGPDDRVTVWEIGTGREILRLDSPKEVMALVFSPDGKALAVGGPQKEGRLIRFPEGNEQAAFKGHTEPLSSLAFSPDGKRLATGSLDGTVRIWDAADGRPVALCPGILPVTGVVFSPDGKTLASALSPVAIGASGSRNLPSASFEVRLWRSGAASPSGNPDDPGQHRRAGALFLDGSRILSPKDTFRAGPESGAYPIVPGSFPAVRYSPDGRLLAFLRSGARVTVINPATRKILSIVGPFSDFVFHPDGKSLITAGFGLQRWDPETGKKIAE